MSVFFGFITSQKNTVINTVLYIVKHVFKISYMFYNEDNSFNYGVFLSYLANRRYNSMCNEKIE